MTTKQASPQAIGWFLKLLMWIGKVMYWVVRVVLWILKRLKPG